MKRHPAGVLVVLLADMVGQVRLAQWHGDFFGAIEKSDRHGFPRQIGLFLGIVSGLLMVVVARTFLQEMLKLRLRERLAEVLMDAWVKPGRAYRPGFCDEGSATPGQRMQEDSRIAADSSAELGVGALNATLLLISFIGVLWALSADTGFSVAGTAVAIPGYMVRVAVLYAVLGSSLTWIVGQRPIRLDTLRYAEESAARRTSGAA